jgi:hypothetical protein
VNDFMNLEPKLVNTGPSPVKGCIYNALCWDLDMSSFTRHRKAHMKALALDDDVSM